MSASQSNTIYGFALSCRHLYCFVMACTLQQFSLSNALCSPHANVLVAVAIRVQSDYSTSERRQ